MRWTPRRAMAAATLLALALAVPAAFGEDDTDQAGPPAAAKPAAPPPTAIPEVTILK